MTGLVVCLLLAIAAPFLVRLALELWIAFRGHFAALRAARRLADQIPLEPPSGPEPPAVTSLRTGVPCDRLEGRRYRLMQLDALYALRLECHLEKLEAERAWRRPRTPETEREVVDLYASRLDS